VSHDIIIDGVDIVTLDAGRRVIAGGWIGIDGERIFVAIPGLIDAHSHAGHGLVRAAGGPDGDMWFDICEEIYARASTPEFWYAEARLALLERLRGGVTTAVSLLGGGGDVMRTDGPEAGDAHCRATAESGLRTLMAVGPNRLPFPKRYARLDAAGKAVPVALDFATQMAVSADLIARWNDVLGRGTGVCLIMPVYTQAHLADPADAALIRDMSEQVMALRAETGVLFTQDGHRNGSVAVARGLGILGPWAALSHSVDLTEADFAALKETGASIIHNPSAIMSILGRCPAPELIEAGINVCLGSDAGAPDRGFDMFRHMKQAMLYHRRHFRDPLVLPEGKVLEMATIDAARALGLERDLGSIEVGKKADIVLVDMRKPHLYPPVMPVLRLTHFASAGDVDTVIVNGKVLMAGRKLAELDEDAILDAAAEQARLAFARAGLSQSRSEPAGLWGRARQEGAPFKASGD